MAISLYGEFSATTPTATSYDVTGVSALTGMVAVAVSHMKTGSSQSITSVTDSAGNTWTYQTSTFQTGSNTRLEIWTAVITSALYNGTVTLNQSTSVPARASISVWNGVANPITVDDVQALGQAATTTPSSVTVTTTNPGDVIVGGLSYASVSLYSTGPGAGWTVLSEGSPSTNFYGTTVYSLPGATGTYGPTWTFPSAYPSGTATIALKPAAIAPPMVSGYSVGTSSGGASTITLDPTFSLASGALSVGDWIIVTLSSASNLSGTNIPTAPGDWTIIVPFAQVGSGTTTFGVWAHKRASGESTYTWSQTTSGGNYTYYRSIFVRGADDISNWVMGSFDYRQNTGTTSTNVAASVTTTTAYNLALLLSEERTTATETDAQVTCTIFTKFFFDNNYDHIIVAGAKILPSPGSTGSSTVTYPNTHNYNGIAGIMGIPPEQAANTADLMWVT